MTPFRERNKTVIGAVGILVLLLFLVGAFKTDSLPFIGGGKTFKAEFTEGAGLQKMDEVRVAGVKVGKVTKIGFKKSCDYPDGTKAGCVQVTMLVKGAKLGALTRAADHWSGLRFTEFSSFVSSLPSDRMSMPNARPLPHPSDRPSQLGFSSKSAS